MFKQKIMRRYLQGRITDPAVWQKKIEVVCKKWLLKTPTLSSSDSGKKNRKRSIQVWQTGTLFQALSEEGTNEPILQKADQKIHTEFDCENITDADFGLLCFALGKRAGFESLRAAMLKYISENQTSDGLVYYKSAVKGVAFVDTLGFICPFLTAYGLSENRQESIDLAKKQIERYLADGTEPHSGLPFHAFEIETHIFRGICDWARGLAWLLIALMDSYLCLHQAGEKDVFYETNIRRYADLILPLQKTSGAFSWQLLAGRDSDSSATAVFGWYLACCYELFGEQAYLDAAKKCREYLMSATFNSGVIDYCQGDTISIGIYSRSFDKMPFAQGFALRMQTRLAKYGS